MVALLLVAVSVGLSNFAAAIGIGTGGVDNRTRLRVALVFGLFETGMPILGLFLGQRFAVVLGKTTHWISGALLIALGLYGLIRSVRSAGDGDARRIRSATRSRLLISGFALSIDNLVIGFALGTYQVAIVTGAVVIGLVSVALSMIGLELGARIGKWSGPRSEQLGGLILISVGVAIAAGTLS
jgi:putative Mn2+ efflux pump MntP